ncbi:protein-glutamate O-methyltransferase CheR [Microcoleus sp. FACHB-1515]|uniref:CheR family methyltransferase n=1 Tax=Cyanophyceae TaxID=3028117 RepID=UPI001689BFD4|nr:protein-glutamate O-methyltransferase CheR [Microcoleus sp. FACHB-1515]MBD2089170.1 protein-glutamate O-methyltransferase CheR [Microcoleus sp. FACHB-1515]
MIQSPELDLDFEALLGFLKRERGCDFTNYKRSSLMRRFNYRMQQLHINSYRDYLYYLQQELEEWRLLQEAVLINFTSFFRDRNAWQTLAQDVIPKIVNSKRSRESIRVWSAGCSTGQELYSLVMTFAEVLGIEACLERVRWYATDRDLDALQQARQAIYAEEDVAEIPLDWLEKYFEKIDRGYVFHSALRRRIVFGHHNLTEDAPMSKIDLLVCRNVLIYLDVETQAAIAVRFHFALQQNGFLFLGQSEKLNLSNQTFISVNSRERIYQKGAKLGLEDHLRILRQSHPSRSSDRPPFPKATA